LCEEFKSQTFFKCLNYEIKQWILSVDGIGGWWVGGWLNQFGNLQIDLQIQFQIDLQIKFQIENTNLNLII
jgi:hypothetical protein